jgi:hypothetical protein
MHKTKKKKKKKKKKEKSMMTDLTIQRQAPIGLQTLCFQFALAQS